MKRVLVLGLLLTVFAALQVNADPSRLINYQGRLVDSNGVPLADGSYDITFKIYDALSGGTLLWTETHTSGGGNPVTVTSGLFSVVLGPTSMPDFNSTPYYIEITVGATVYSPRKQLTGAPFAVNADLLDGQHASYYQRRVSGTCGVGSSIRIINADGTVTCQTDVGSAGHGSLTGLDSDDHTQYVHISTARTITAQHSFAPAAAQAPFTLGGNAQGQLVTGLNADQLDGYHYTSFILDGCTDCLNATEIEDIYVLNTSDTMSGSLSVGTDLTVSGNIIGDIRVDDTRAVNEAPTAFDREVSFDFKNRATVGAPGSGTYSGMITIAPWSDNSGDASHQLNFNEGGIFWRQGQPDSATWDPWYQIGYNENLDDRYVNITGDTMTGNLSIDYAGNPGIELRANAGGTPYLDFSNDGASDYDGRIRLTGNASLTIEGANLYMPNATGIYFGGNTQGSDASRLYTGASDRLFVRAEDTDGIAQFANYGLYLPSPLASTYNLYTGNGIQAAYSSAANIDWRNGGNITTNSGTYTPISFSSTSGYAHFGNGSGITMGDNPIYLRGSYGSDPNHGFIYNSTVDGPEFRGFTGFIWKNGASGATERMRLTGDGVVVPANLAAKYIATVIGPDTGADNQTHTVYCPSGYAIVNFSVYASNYWDGNITLTCMYLGSLLNTGNNAWEDTTLETCDGCWHTATCSGGRVATGFRAYASGRIDTNLQLYCTLLNTSSYTSMSNWMSSGNNDEANDDSMQGASCPAGTFLYGLAVYANSYPDGDLRIICRAPIP